mmetsp:Transcript_14733/g.30505  ORF Transcript_14733/g.30505 Transcript_14733/m.30505 type:complete len:616 (-) Transcript_14733:124-1971(-)
MDSLQLRTGESSMVVPGAAMPSTRAVLVSACGQLFEMPPTVLSSMTLLLQDLAGQLKMSSSVGLQLADAGGVPIRTDSELSAVLREGRHPMRVTPTVAALREIEQKKFEVETKKEQMTQFQWQIVVDQIAAFSQEVAGVTGQLQAVKDACRKSLDEFKQEVGLQNDKVIAAIERETQAREAACKDLDIKADKMCQVVSHDRSVRDVADHQLGKQIEQVASALDEERSVRTQEKAESSRFLAAMRHDLDAEMKRAAETWNQHLDMVKRLDLQMEAHTAGQFEQQQRLTKLEADTDKLQGMTAGLDASLAAHHRSVSEDLQRRGDELSKAVRDEMLSRENHVNRFAKDLETSWQSMEARMQRIREETNDTKATLTERSRVMEQRCAELEHAFQFQTDAQAAKDHTLFEKVTAASVVVDAVEVGQKASDVLLQNTVAKVEDLTDRLFTAEGDLQKKVHKDYWTPQMEALERGMHRHEAKLTTMEKEMNIRFYQESTQRDKAKSQIQDSMKACLDKFSPTKPGSTDRRFVEVTDESQDPTKAAWERDPKAATGLQFTSVAPGGGLMLRNVSVAPGYASPRAMAPQGQFTSSSPQQASTPRMRSPSYVPTPTSPLRAPLA